MHDITRNQSRGMTERTKRKSAERKGLRDERERRRSEGGWCLRGSKGGYGEREWESVWERERERERERGGERERERERGREHSRLPASQSASPGQHRPGIVAYAPAPLLSRTINLASIPDRPFSMSPSTFVATCAPVVCVCVRARARARAHGHAVSARLVRVSSPRMRGHYGAGWSRDTESIDVEISPIRE